jgi:hypothetical protein
MIDYQPSRLVRRPIIPDPLMGYGALFFDVPIVIVVLAIGGLTAALVEAYLLGPSALEITAIMAQVF